MGCMLLPCFPEKDSNRREFLASFLGALLFWRPHRKKLAGIPFRVIRNGHSARRYLLIHGNEATAREVLTEHLRTAHGTAYLIENKNRNIQFQGGELDPNRMFSRAGAERNLRTLNPKWQEDQILKALRILDGERQKILDAVRPEKGDVLIAVHNNRDYSLADEVASSNRTALKDKGNPHEFCLCTDENDFQLLSNSSYNVVLQNRPQGVEDGSLSRYAAVAGFRYANLEAGLGQSDKQRRMLEWLDKTLPRA